MIHQKPNFLQKDCMNMFDLFELLGFLICGDFCLNLANKAEEFGLNLKLRVRNVYKNNFETETFLV